ncbi:MAG TPA: hypothetical protein VHD87_03555, partial [Acidimicrobiales bacterium]|nr:hypothetical protein [Acidimicrobiales bacterium]
DVVDGMPAAATGPGGAPCQGNGCVAAVAKATLAAYVVRGTLEIDGRTYELRLEMLDGKTGDLIESREDRCEICTEGEALETAGNAASTLEVQTLKKKSALAKGLGEVTGTQVTVVPAPTKAVMVAAPPGSGIAEGGPHEGPSGVRGEERRELGWIGVGVGLFAGFVGGELIAHDGDPTCAAGHVDNDPMHLQCEHSYATKGWGITSIVGGALAVAAGVLVLTGKF